VAVAASNPLGLANQIRKGLSQRGTVADHEAYDPEFIRENLPAMWLLATLYFRAEVRGFEHVPDAPTLQVGNHSGGIVIPDTWIHGLGWYAYFGVERPLRPLVHSAAISVPLAGEVLRKTGCMPASPANAREALRRGEDVLVYPGGDVETWRPWSKRNQIDFDGRTGFLRLAAEEGVPIVPVVSIGAHETFAVLTDGKKIAKRLGIDKLLRIKVFPLTLGLPFGINPGPMIPHFPLPSKIVIQCLPAIEITKKDVSDANVKATYDKVVNVFQKGLDKLARERKRPVLG
jgi:1-acyl-sn-glycerol-3-phosphate acyltransferase